MLREQIQTAMKTALKQGEKEKLMTLRMILSSIKDKDVEVRVDETEATEAGDSHILKVLESLVKQRRQSAHVYKECDRMDLAEKEEKEIKVIQEFLPQQLTEAEQAQAIADCIAKTGATSIKDMAAVMACLRESYAGKIDFSQASAKVKALLS